LLVTIIGRNIHVVADNEDQKESAIHTAAVFGTVLERDGYTFDLIVSHGWDVNNIKDIIERAA